MCRVRGASPTLTLGSSSTPVLAAIATTSSTSISISVAPVTSATEAAAVQVKYVSTSDSDISSTTPDATPSSTPDSEAVVAAIQTYSTPSPPAQSSSAPVTPAVVNSGSGSSGWTNTNSKFGAAWPNGNWASPSDPDYVGNYIGTRTSWYYTWSPFSVSSADSLGLEFVPMLWGPKQVGDWYAQMPNWPSTVKNALFFNEPNEGSQCNISPGDSVSYWMNDMVPLKAKGIALGGAATTSAPSGLQWVLDFKNACVGAGNSVADCTPS